MGTDGEYSLFRSVQMTTNINISFTGEFRNNIDQKNRLSIPVKYRRSLLPENNCTFVLTRGFDQCLVLYPLNEWKKVEIQLADLSSIKSKHRKFLRTVVRYATHVQYDSQGRIQVLDNLLEYADITKNVSLIGMIKKIEIWNPNILENYDSDFTKNDFEDLSNEIKF